MTTYVHPTAKIHSSVILHPGVWIGPNVHIDEGVVIGHYSVIGGMPEHKGFYDDPEMTRTKGVHIRAGARIFEFVTVHQGTIRTTEVGEGAAVFNKSHVAHDCVLERGCQIGGQVSLAGHITVMPFANISGKSCLLQFAVIGAYAFVGGFTFVTNHVPPGEKWIGFPARPVGKNEIGLQRAGLSYDEVISQYGERFNNLSKEKRL